VMGFSGATTSTLGVHPVPKEKIPTHAIKKNHVTVCLQSFIGIVS